jgi:hypothetical protein
VKGVASLVLAAALAGCPSGGGTGRPTDPQGGGAGGGSGSGSGSGLDAQPAVSAAGTPGPAPSAEGLCELAKRTFDRAQGCLAADKRDAQASTGQTLTGLMAAPAAGMRAAAGACSQIIDNLDHAAAATKCDLGLTADERARVSLYLGYRTTPGKTGDGAVDGVLTELAKLRNQMCACAEKACAIDVNHGIDNLAAMPDAATPTARADYGLMIDELGRCANRLR